MFGMDFSAKANMKLAFQVYGVRDMCERDFAGTLKAVRAIGYTGVETGRFYGLDAKGLGAVVRGAGLELVALQLYPHNLTEPQLGETIRFCKECGCRRINVAWYKGSKENPNDWQLLVNVLKREGGHHGCLPQPRPRVPYARPREDGLGMAVGRRTW